MDKWELRVIRSINKVVKESCKGTLCSTTLLRMINQYKTDLSSLNGIKMDIYIPNYEESVVSELTGLRLRGTGSSNIPDVKAWVSERLPAKEIALFNRFDYENHMVIKLERVLSINSLSVSEINEIELSNDFRVLITNILTGVSEFKYEYRKFKSDYVNYLDLNDCIGF